MKTSHFKLQVPDDIAELVRTMHPHLKKKIKASLQIILLDPFAGKALKDELAGLRSFRVSKFRIVYRILNKKQIGLVAVGPREKIYEETFRLIQKSKL